MPEIARRYWAVPIEDLVLEQTVYDDLVKRRVHRVGDLFTLPEEVLMLYLDRLVEGIERIIRADAPIPD